MTLDPGIILKLPLLSGSFCFKIHTNNPDGQPKKVINK